MLKGKLPHSTSLYITGEPTDSDGLNWFTEVTLEAGLKSFTSKVGSGEEPKGEPGCILKKNQYK